jgi:hypothetical protein
MGEVRRIIMVQSATATAATGAETHRSSAPAQSNDSDFMSVLRNTAKRNPGPSDSDQISSSSETSQREYRKTTPSNQDSSETTETRNDKDPAAELDQIIDRMAAIVQQIMNNPQPKDASALMEDLFGQNGTAGPSAADLSLSIAGDGGLQTRNSGAGALGQNAQSSGAAVNNPNALFSQLTANAVAAAEKQGDAGDMSDQNNPNGAFQFNKAMNSDKVSLLGGAEKTATQLDEAFSQLKTEALTTRSGDVKGSGGLTSLYGQSVNPQDMSVRSTQGIQETISVNRISAVEEAISKAVNTGQRDIVIRIDPPDLGSVHIRLSLDNGVLKADVKVDSAAVKDTFLAAMPQIKTALENSGIKASNFNVDVRDDQNTNGQSGNNNAKQQQRQDGEAKNAFSDFFA